MNWSHSENSLLLSAEIPDIAPTAAEKIERHTRNM